jgi:hypothetical protein
VAAISVVLIDDLTISLLNKNPPAAGRGRRNGRRATLSRIEGGRRTRQRAIDYCPVPFWRAARPRSGHPASPGRPREPRMEGPDKWRLSTIFEISPLPLMFHALTVHLNPPPPQISLAAGLFNELRGMATTAAKSFNNVHILAPRLRNLR